MFLRNIKPKTKSMFTMSFRSADALTFAPLSSDSFTSSRAQMTDSALADHLVFDRFFNFKLFSTSFVCSLKNAFLLVLFVNIANILSRTANTFPMSKEALQPCSTTPCGVHFV